jgi:hypothetical protein
MRKNHRDRILDTKWMRAHRAILGRDLTRQRLAKIDEMQDRCGELSVPFSVKVLEQTHRHANYNTDPVAMASFLTGHPKFYLTDNRTEPLLTTKRRLVEAYNKFGPFPRKEI